MIREFVVGGSHMGMGQYDLRVIRHLLEKGVLPTSKGRVIEIGAQQLSADFLSASHEVDELARVMGASRAFAMNKPMNANNGLSPDAPLSRPFWEWLGYAYASIDLDGSPGAIPLDLNFDQAPLQMRGRFDLVTNYGTTEHLINQYNAFKVIHDLTKLGGIMVHNLPAQGYTNHGLINYNMKFFWALSKSNCYRWHHMDFAVAGNSPPINPDIIQGALSYSPDIAERLSEYRVPDGMVAVALQKVHDMDFVAPIDVPPNSETSNPVLKKRYWTVFDPARVEKLHRRVAFIMLPRALSAFWDSRFSDLDADPCRIPHRPPRACLA